MASKSTHVVRGLAFALLCTVSVPALAQLAPSTVQPSQVQRRLESEPYMPRGEVQVITPEDERLTGEASDQEAFVLENVVLEDSTAYTAEDFRDLYMPYIGQRVSFADLRAISQAMTARYRNDGYVLSRVVMPPQEIENGVVRFRAVEGYVSNVQFEGEIEGDRALLESYGRKITAERPLTTATMERYLLLVDDLPGVLARSVIQPDSQTPGAATLVVTLDHDDVEGAVGADNRGNRFVGPYQLTAVAAANSALGMYDRTTVRGVVTAEFEELFFGEITHEQQLGSEGTRMEARVASTYVEPGARLEPLDIEGDSQVYELNFLHPYIRSREENLDLLGGFRFQDGATDILGTELYDDQVRALSLGFAYDVADTWNAINLVSGSVTRGLDILGASDEGLGRSRINGEPEFTRLNAAAERLQNIDDQWSLLLTTAAQYSPDSLLISEQLPLGGAAFGRAYDGAEITGDSGLAGLVELRYALLDTNTNYIQNTQFFGFYDVGTVWLNDPLVGEEGTESLSSVGLGVRANMLEDVSGQLLVALPLTRDVASEGDDDPRLFFNILKRF